MSKQPHYFAIGLFILIALGLAVVGIILLGGSALSSPNYYLETYVNESVQGLDVGTPFKFRGVKVGSISEIKLTSMEYDTKHMYVLLRVALDEDALMTDADSLQEQIADMVGNGLRVKLTPMGITGLSFLEADYYPDSADEPLEIDWKPKYLYIPSKPALMTKVGHSIDKLTRQLDEIHLKAIADHIENITSNLNISVTEDFMPILKNVEERLESMASTFENLDKIMRLAAQEAPPILANARAASERLPQISSNLNAAVDQLQLLIEDNTGEVDEIITNIKYITDDAKEFIRMIKKYPGMLLTEPPKEITE